MGGLGLIGSRLGLTRVGKMRTLKNLLIINHWSLGFGHLFNICHLDFVIFSGCYIIELLINS
jgi:hypothetical protein